MTVTNTRVLPGTITIPTETELRDTLAGLERLITTKEWERAAIVYAFTTNDGPGGDHDPEVGHGFPVSMREFARRGFGGLRSKNTVARYRQVWQRAIDQGYAIEVRPGDVVNLPIVPWADFYDSTEGDSRYKGVDTPALREQAHINELSPATVLTIAKNSKAMTAAIMGDPNVAAAALAALRSRGDIPDPAAAVETERRAREAEAAARKAKAAADDALAKVETRVKEAAAQSQGRLAKLTQQLEEAERENTQLSKDSRATNRELQDVNAKMTRLREQRHKEEVAHRRISAELAALRTDPERVRRATSRQQYDRLIGLLYKAQGPLAEADNWLDTEQSVLEGDEKESIIQTADYLIIRLTSIKARVGADFRL